QEVVWPHSRQLPGPGSVPVLATFTAVLLLSLGGCDQPEADPRTADMLVRLVSVEPASPGERAFTGTVAARVQSDLGCRINGKIVEPLVDTGQVIQASTPLYRLDATDYEHAVTAQLGNVAAAKARLIQA